MTVIAWDGYQLASDSQLSRGDLKTVCTKIFRKGTAAYATCGPAADGRALEEWYRRGASLQDFPPPSGESWATLIVATPKGCVVYQLNGHAMAVEAPFAAWGSGSEIAVGAMAAGCNAAQAVQIAIDHGTYCGGPVQQVFLKRVKSCNG